MRHILDQMTLALVAAVVTMRFGRLLVRSFRSRPPGERRWPNVAVPRTGDDKFLWRKIFDRDPRFITMSDKLACKAWVASLGLGLDMAEVRWVGQEAALIPPDLLARDVVVKANHGWGTNLFPQRDGLTRDEVVRRASAFLQQDHGVGDHQWGYLGVPRQLFVEDALGGQDERLVELKFYTFGPLVPRAILIADRFGEPEAARWEPSPGGEMARFEERSPLTQRFYDGPLPATFPRALALAKAIGDHFDHMRVDLLTDGEGLWLGELTVYNLSGRFFDVGHLSDSSLTRAWDLRRSWFLQARHANLLLRLYAAALRRRLAREPQPDLPASL